MLLTIASREILWNIPATYQFIMYGLFLASLGVLLWKLRETFRWIKGSSNEKLFPESLQWVPFFKTLLLQGKLPRRAAVARFHALIFYSFLILTIATELVAIHSDTPFKVFQGTTYIVISFLADIAGVLILAGLVFAFRRRYIEKPTHLSATRPGQEKTMYGFLAALVITGFLLEGLRILGTGMPSGEVVWSPVGWVFALLFAGISASDAAISVTHQYLWLFHMILTMAFVAAIGFTKFSHMIFAPLGALITPKYRGAVLEPMDFEDEDAESFGLEKVSGLTPKQRFDTVVCVECGRCSQACPALRSGKSLDPKLIITKMRDFSRSQDGKSDVSVWEEGKELYAIAEIDACTTCGACMEECPMNIEHIPTIMGLKRYKTLTLGNVPPTAVTTIRNIQNQGNPWGRSRESRMDWAEGLDVPIADEQTHVEYLYYTGCAGSYDPDNQKVVKHTVALLNAAGVSFALMGKAENCNGDPVRRIGDEYSFNEIAIENIANINRYKFDTIITQCPHCMHTIGKEYAKFEGGNFNVLHHTELLADLVKQGKLKTQNEIRENMTFHDPCYLGRHHGNYDSPREILSAIPGLSLSEMEESKDSALCCGMGGGNMWYETPDGEHLSKNRLKQIARTGSPNLVTACSYCMINFNSSKTGVPETEELVVEDVASILHRSVIKE